MNKFASFRFNDQSGMNALMEKYPPADGKNIFVSDGQIILQYDDGEEQPAAVKIVSLKEAILTMERAKEEIVHSNKVNELQIADAESAVTVAHADMEKIQTEIAGSRRGLAKLKQDLADAETRYNTARARARDVKSQLLLNNAEIARLDTNIELYRERIEELRKTA